MKEIRLNKLVLNGFRAQKRTITFSDVTNIYGRNKSGKSTTFDSWMWLLTGADAEGRTNFNLFDTRVDYTKENSVPISVEADITIDGVDFKLKREAAIGWVRKRGNDYYERSGSDNYSYSIDDIQRSAKEFNTWVESNIGDVEIIKCISNIRYFSSLDWKEQRKKLADMSGEIKQEDFKGCYINLFEQMKKYSLDEIKARIKTLSKPLREAINALPHTIETLELSLPNLSEIPLAKANIENYKKRISDIDAALQGSDNLIKPYIDKRNDELKEISNLRVKMTNEKFNYEDTFNKELRKLNDALEKVKLDNETIDIRNNKEQERRNAIKENKNSILRDIEALEKERESLLTQRDEIKAKVFKEDKCPYCGQELPLEKMNEAIERFNTRKKLDIDAIVSKGKNVRGKIDSLNARLAECESLLNAEQIVYTHTDTTDLENAVNEKKASFVKYEDTEQYNALMNEIKDKEQNLTQIPQQDNDDLNNEKAELISKVALESRKLGLEDEYNRQQGIIQSKKIELRENSNELAKQEQLSSEVEAYEREMAQIVRNRVNGMFKRVQVEMFKQDKSGTWIPTCEFTSNGGEKGSIWNAAEITLGGIDISNAFAKYYGVCLPLFIDNFDGLSSDSRSILGTIGQVITLCVSDDDKLVIKHS